MATMIGIDPHEGSHTAVAIDRDEHVLDEYRVRSCAAQADRLREWAARFEDRTWAIESAQGLGYLLARQLVDAGEVVLDVPPMRAAVCVCWVRGGRKRTTRTTLDQSRSRRCEPTISLVFMSMITPECCACW